MSRLQDTPEEADFRERLHSWLETNTPQIDGKDVEALKAWQKKLFEAGWLGLNWPSEYGGQGVGFREQMIYNDEVVRRRAPQTINGIGLMIVGPALIAVGSEEQRNVILPLSCQQKKSGARGFQNPTPVPT